MVPGNVCDPQLFAFTYFIVVLHLPKEKCSTIGNYFMCKNFYDLFVRVILSEVGTFPFAKPVYLKKNKVDEP